MWLDGLYMGSPFLAGYARTFNEPAAFDEVVRQIRLMDNHAYDAAAGLHYHGWDEKREQDWADPGTGRSASFWGRAIGWYAMSLVDCLDELPENHPGAGELRRIFVRLCEGLIRHQDPPTGLWWQVVDQPNREGNYLESSASAMFVYAMAKGMNRRYLPRDVFHSATVKAYDALVKLRTRTDDAGNLHLTHVCEVSGLGFKSAKGIPRDGSFAYYISEPVIENDLKGVGPFILAGIEMQRLATTRPEPSASDPPSVEPNPNPCEEH
jgi:unsaturated rhamnogalacturonyl hydrolase